VVEIGGPPAVQGEEKDTAGGRGGLQEKERRIVRGRKRDCKRGGELERDGLQEEEGGTARKMGRNCERESAILWMKERDDK
jgi:hypothetical protein